MNTLLLNNGSLLSSPRPEDLVRAFIIASVAPVLRPPLPGLVKWLSRTSSAYDGSEEYWSPYGQAKGAVYLKPWARGGYNFLAVFEPGWSPVDRLDPSAWAVGFMRLFHDSTSGGGVVSDAVRAAFEVAADQTSPDGLSGDRVIERWGAVRRAQQEGRLLTDSRKIARALARADER